MVVAEDELYEYSERWMRADTNGEQWDINSD